MHGKYSVIRKSSRTGSDYYNYKHSFSRYNFICVS
nr:unnamed protein product [Callosobruchus analis]